MCEQYLCRIRAAWPEHFNSLVNKHKESRNQTLLIINAVNRETCRSAIRVRPTQHHFCHQLCVKIPQRIQQWRWKVCAALIGGIKCARLRSAVTFGISSKSPKPAGPLDSHFIQNTSGWNAGGGGSRWWILPSTGVCGEMRLSRKKDRKKKSPWRIHLTSHTFIRVLLFNLQW